MKKKHICVVGLLSFFIAASLAILRNTSHEPIVASCIDCESAPIVLDEIASSHLRRSYSGLGSIQPSTKIIPIAVFTIDGAEVWWTGQELHREGFPFDGLCTTWTFPQGATISATKRELALGNQQRFEKLVELLQSDHK